MLEAAREKLGLPMVGGWSGPQSHTRGDSEGDRKVSMPRCVHPHPPAAFRSKLTQGQHSLSTGATAGHTQEGQYQGPSERQTGTVT